MEMENGRVIFIKLLKSNKLRKEDSFAAVYFKGCSNLEIKGLKIVLPFVFVASSVSLHKLIKNGF